MHETGLCASVLEVVERRAAGRKVKGVRVRVGIAHRVLPEAFDEGFAHVATGTVAEGADVDLVVVPAQAECVSCSHTWDTDDPFPACPACESVNVDSTGGDVLILESITLEG